MARSFALRPRSEQRCRSVPTHGESEAPTHGSRALALLLCAAAFRGVSMLTPRKAAHLTGEDIQATLYACLTSGQVIQVSGHEEKGGAWDAQGTGLAPSFASLSMHHHRLLGE